MIRTKTLFVVGAGASYELGFPLGENLLKNISDALNFRLNYGSVDGGSQDLWRTLCRAFTQNGVNLQDYLEAAWRVRDAAHIGLSIDNVVHQQFDDNLVVHVAKIAIAHQLLLAEDKSDLKIPDNRNTVTWPRVCGTWLGRFAQLICQDIDRKNIDEIFDNVSVISFNYDRTIRRFMPLALMSQFAIPEAKAYEISKKLRIYHPYGSLGPLQWEVGSNPVLFGMPDRADLLNVAYNLRTFTERIDHSEQLSEMRHAIFEADRIVFLGFGYLSQNMMLITQGLNGNAGAVMGTSYGLSESDSELVSSQLGAFFRDPFRSYKAPLLSPIKCEQFIRENFRSLTS